MTSPSDPLRLAGRRRRISLLILLVCAVVAGGWRYRITRPDYRLARGQQAIRDHDAEAVRAYANRLESAGYPDHAHLLRGEALLEFGAPAEALVQFNKIRDEGAIRLRAAALSGRCLLQLGELKEAQRVFDYVASEEPNNLDAHRGLGAIAYDLGQLDDAVGHLRRVAELDPADARPHRLIGLIYKDMSQNPEAEEAYREALRRGLAAPVEREVRVELAELLAKQGKYAAGIEVLDALPPDGADDPAAAASRAECLRGLGRPQQAVGVVDAALARHSTAALHRLRGQLYHDEARLADAVRCYERAVELEPGDYQSHYLLSQAYTGAGRTSDAARALARSEALHKDLDRITALTKEAMAKPWDAAVRLQLAELAERLGKPQLAAMWRKAAAACSRPDR
jgi:tetratricopeptide (TPR) repeat protein